MIRVLLLLTYVLCSFSYASLSEEEALYLKVFGNKVKPTSSKVSIPIYLDDEYIGLALITIQNKNGKDTLLTQKYHFLPILQDILKQDTFEQYKQSIEKLNGNEVEIKEIICCGVSYKYDESKLAIYVYTDANVRKKQTIYFKKFNKFVSKNAVKSASFSGAINMYLNQSFENKNNDTNIEFNPLRLKFNSFSNVYGYVVENKFHLNYYDHTNEDQDLELRREETSVSTIWQDQNIKFSLGDVLSQKTEFISSTSTLGIALEKKKSKYHFNKRETTRIGQTTLFLENDSKVELYVNDIKRNSLNLKAGTHDLVDFSMDTGLNNVRIKIEDIYGKVSFIEYTDFFYGNVLKSGENEYGFSLGVPSQVHGGIVRYLDDIWFSSAYFKQGFEHLTLSITAQKSNTTYLLFGGKVLFPVLLVCGSMLTVTLHLMHTKEVSMNLGILIFTKILQLIFHLTKTVESILDFQTHLRL